MSDREDSEREDAAAEERFSLCEFDLDVVDDALLNPNNNEFHDHFGFRIQVKTDDEYDEDTSDSDESDDEKSKAGQEKPSTVEDAHQSTATTPEHSGDTNVAGSPTRSSNDHGDSPVDMAINDKTTVKDAVVPSVTPPSIEQEATLPPSSNGPPEVRRRGRSQTVSKASIPAVVPVATPAPLEKPAPNRRSRAMTVSKPPAFLNAASPARMQSTTSTERSSCVEELTATVKEEEEGEGEEEEKEEEEEDLEIIELEPNMELALNGCPNGASAIPDPPSRPSQVFQDRQSKRMSQFMSQPHSPPAKSAASSSLSSQSSSGSNFYDMLVSKFGRQSQDQQANSSKQEALKQETSHSLDHLKKTSGDNHDWDFWASMIQDADSIMNKDTAKLRQHLTAGVPSQLRGMMWQIFSKSRTNADAVEIEYKELLKRTSPHEKVIRRDLARTFPTHAFFKERDGEGQEMLFNVIKAYSIFDQQVGYCQGLPFVVGCLLLHMPDEAAFCVLIKLMVQYRMRGHFTPHMETLHERMYQFEHLLQKHLPQVHRHLDAQGVRPTMYASQWFMTLFAYRCPLDLVFCVFDLVFVEGPHIMLNFALALMRRNQSTILSLEFESLLEFFSSEVYEAFKGDPSGFVQDAYSFDVSTRQLTKLAKQHAAEAAREAKIQSQEDTLRRRNAELTSQLRQLQSDYKSLENDHQDIAQQVIETKMEMARMDNENQQLKHQISVLRVDMERIQSSMSAEQQSQFDAFAYENAQLVERNSQLEDQLASIEAILIDLKMKYAESENEYEMMKQKLQGAQKIASRS